MCNKVSLTLKEAREALKITKGCHKQYRKEQRYYHCGDCNTWHLTSMPAKVPPQKSDVNLKYPDQWKNLLHEKDDA